MIERLLEPEVMDSADEANDYDAMDHSQVNQVFVDDLLSLASETWTAENIDILDLGTGTARIPIELCHRVEEIRVLAIDLAASMLDVAKMNIDFANLLDRIMLDLMDAKQLDLDDDRFDATISNSIIHHVPNPATVISETIRVTKPDGVVFLRDLMRPSSINEVDKLVQQYAGAENEHAQEMFYNSLRAALSIDEMRDLVRSHGFDSSTVQATSDRHWTWAATNV